MTRIDKQIAAYNVEYTEDSLLKQVNAIVEMLHRKANEIERISVSRIEYNHTATEMVSEIQHTALWMLANLNLDTLTDRAAKVTEARAQLEAITGIATKAEPIDPNKED